MLGLIIKKEIFDILKSKKFIMTFPVIAVLIILSFFAGIKNYQVQQRQYEAALAENIRQMSGITDWMQISHSIYLPPNPLYCLVNGISNDIGRNITMYGMGELVPKESRFNENPLFAIFLFFDLEFLFLVILSLFAILFGYNLVNGEKEKGTLRLVLSNAIPRDQFILGKISGAILAISLPLLLPILIGCLLIFLLQVPFSSDDWLKLCLIIFSGFIYFSLILTISILFSSITRHSSHSFLLALVAWIFFILIIPRVAVLIGGRMVDVPSVDEIASQKSRYRAQLWAADLQKMNHYKGEQTQDIEKMMQSFQKFMTELSEERNKKLNELNQRLNEDRINRRTIQENIAFNLARISPAALFSLTVTKIAGTSIDLKQRFLKAANRYQSIYAQFLKNKLNGSLPEAGMVRVKINDEENDPIDTSELPVFNFTKPRLLDSLFAAFTDLSCLILLNIILFAATVYAFLKFDVR